MEEIVGSRSSDTSFAVGFAIGAVLGISIAFMLAPYSGEETRDLIKDKAQDVKGRVKEATGNRRKIYTDSWKQPKVKPYAGTFD
jgi:gas vesicle protein